MSEPWSPAAREVAATLLDVVQTRLDLAATEIELSRLRLARRGLWLMAGLFFAALGLVLGAGGLVLLVDEGHRAFALGLLGAISLAAAAVAAWRWHQLGLRCEPMLRATLEELRKDRDGIAASLRA